MLGQWQPNMRACKCISSVPSAIGKGIAAIDEDGQQQEWTDRGAKPGWLHSRRQQIQHPTPRSLVRPIVAQE